MRANGAAHQENDPVEPPGRRPYHAPRRTKAAAETREAILGAATRLFVDRGYAKVTVAEVAREAGTAVPTVYASTGGKGAILTLLTEEGLRTTAATETLALVRETGVAREALTAATHGTRLDNESHHRLVRVMVSAAHTDGHAAEALARANHEYREGLAAVTRRLCELDALRSGLTSEVATDILWFYLGHHSWHELVVERGWSWDTTETWLAGQVTAALLPEENGG
ncbi:TetR/AcrR family transcriptional regulator [Streptomyces tsukubensis]|uniref:TetR/AcrR family transcriptional regulator n=1 Tax=Streptomyces tsukubensis TaxID=83656 RepID=UPI0015C2E121|nr:TetR/AcrR family transcriptional regulator [Streptomyces tsukubensis]